MKRTVLGIAIMPKIVKLSHFFLPSTTYQTPNMQYNAKSQSEHTMNQFSILL